MILIFIESIASSLIVLGKYGNYNDINIKYKYFRVYIHKYGVIFSKPKVFVNKYFLGSKCIL